MLPSIPHHDVGGEGREGEGGGGRGGREGEGRGWRGMEGAFLRNVLVAKVEFSTTPLWSNPASGRRRLMSGDDRHFTVSRGTSL